MPSSKTRVAVIGAGVAGLVSARHLSSRLDTFSLTVFEQSEHIGGTWIYTDAIDYDKHGIPIHSSMYKNLKTNLPKEIMQIPDYPFRDIDGPSFVHHSVIRKYLESYAKHFNLRQYVKTQTIVNWIEPEVLPNGQTVYLVTYTNLNTKISQTNIFDAIILGNGHYSVGQIPTIRGMDTFPGSRVHSHQYRIPEKYTNKKVCILGASWSGIDIALEVCKYAKKIYLSHNLPKPIDARMSDVIEQRPGIEQIDGNMFIFKDGSCAEVDDFIYCTGYKFTYPFLSPKVNVCTQDNHVEPVYKHIVHMDAPNIFFLGLPDIGIPFPMVHFQVQYIVAVLEGRVKLPSSKKMHQAYDAEKQELLAQGIPLRHINKIKDRQWAYYEELAMAASAQSFPPVVRMIYEHVSKMRDEDFMTYKNYRYRIISDHEFEVTYCKIC